MTPFERRTPRPSSFDLSDAQVAIAVDFVCHGGKEAGAHVSVGMWGPPLTDVSGNPWAGSRKSLASRAHGSTGKSR